MSAWSKVRLGEVLRHRKEFITIHDLTTYKRSRVQLHAQGIILRDEVPGALIKTKMQQVCRTGEFLVAEIDAKVGGFGIVPELLDGSIVSSHYFLFVIDEAELDRQFLDYFIRTPAFREQVEAQGSTNYAAIRPAYVLGYEIPLPPLPEQRRMVARIEELAAQIHEARTLRQQAAEEAEALIHSSIGRLAYETAWEMKRLPEVTEINPSRTGNVKLAPDDMVSFVPMKAVDDVTGTIAWPETRPLHEVAKGYTWFTNGDIIMARITPCMQNGKAALAKNLVNGVAFGSTEFHVIRPGKSVYGEWIYHLVRHKAFRDDAADHFKGTAGQQRVPKSFFEEKLIPVPPLHEQRRIVAALDALQVEVDALKRLQAETAAELYALLPSILDKAFKGELP
jgi:type I restriction enzyme S subunit